MSGRAGDGVSLRARITGGTLAAIFAALTALFLAAMGWLVFHPVGPLPLAVVLLLYAGAMLVTLRLWRWSRGETPQTSSQRANARFTRRYVSAMVLYVLVLFGSLWINGDYDVARPLLWLVAIAPSLPLLAAIASLGLYIREEKDEFQRTIMVHAHVIAMGLTLAICTVYGFLETFRLVRHIPLWSVFPLFAMCFGPAQVIVRWRYR